MFEEGGTKLVDQNSPRAYDLADAREQRRLFSELRGYLNTCHRHHHGTDSEGRLFAADALKEILARGLKLEIS